MEKNEILNQLIDYFNKTPRDVIEKEWHEYDKYNEVGPTIEEYMEFVNSNKKPQYPKTYEECCEVLNICPNGDIVYAGNWVYGDGGEYLEKHLERIRNFQKLLICRNAYWKLAGDEMGLDKPWSPSKNDNVYCIFRLKGGIVKDNFVFGDSLILEFPTEEMRDAFYENFKDKLEICKELL